MSTVAQTSKERNWIVDSRASVHMCNDKPEFSQFLADAHLFPVSIGDETSLTVHGIGTILAITAVNGKKWSIELKDVFFVQDISSKLLSVPRCRADGLHIVFKSSTNGSGICFAEDHFCGKKDLCGIERYEKGLPEAILKPVPDFEQGLNFKTDNHSLWHWHIGHVSKATISKTVILVKGLPNLSEKEKNCKIFAVCNFKRKPRPVVDVKNNKAELLEILHCNFQGPLQLTSLRSARYFVPILDECSGLSIVQLLKRKSEAATVVQETLLAMGNLTH